MSSVAFGQPAWVDAITDALELQVATVTKLPRDRVYTYFGQPSDLLQFPPADEFVVFGGPSLPVDQAVVRAGGAEHTAFNGRFPVHVFARLASDQQFRDTKFLREASKGLGRLVRATVKALQVFGAVSNGASPLREPSRIHGVTFSPRSIPTGWGWATLDVEAKFRTDFTA